MIALINALDRRGSRPPARYRAARGTRTKMDADPPTHEFSVIMAGDGFFVPPGFVVGMSGANKSPGTWRSPGAPPQAGLPVATKLAVDHDCHPYQRAADYRAHDAALPDLAAWVT